MTRKQALAKLSHARNYLARRYCVAFGVGFGRWNSEAARRAYALLSGKIREVKTA